MSKAPTTQGKDTATAPPAAAQTAPAAQAGRQLRIDTSALTSSYCNFTAKRVAQLPSSPIKEYETRHGELK